MTVALLMFISQIISKDYVIRRSHVLEKHFEGNAGLENPELLSAEIRRCFPGCLIYSDEQVRFKKKCRF